jgi:hypothetical protein
MRNCGRKSVEGFNILDKRGRVLYDGDFVEYCWGGQAGQRILETHRLRINKTGHLSISGCANIIYANELVKLDAPEHPLGKRYTRPWVDER